MPSKVDYNKFIKELEKLSKKYGVVIKSVGGVTVGNIKNIRYSNDYTSSDLLPETIEWE